MTASLAPLPVGTVVEYRGSQKHGRYVVAGHTDPREEHLFQPWEHVTEDVIAAAYPDGVAYELWPEGMEQRFGNRQHMVYRARRKSITEVRAPARKQ